MDDKTPLWKQLASNGAMLMAGTPQAQALGLVVVSIEEARAVVEVDWREELVGDLETGVIASGVVTTLLDNTCGVAAFAALSEPTAAATLDLRIDYMRPAKKGATLRAHAHCYHMSKTIAFVRAFAFDSPEEKDPVAAAQATFIMGTSGHKGHNQKPAS
ncbi:PaaI family thioesterase [Candidatus Phycosocius spiralis]|uniref:Thioesterase domain-containing protein n=1 Tax=Candidatus Phycosocius spiralis TaxID=2815099 RepID=A0ABQ4PWQ8_9PROT|nr:PaaI family thioesterase [Candidatus Phycosocius spiralis]GIU67453.1 hypothetical protein PsB1_1607 [Candidatus Phycosocius spiralis]